MERKLKTATAKLRNLKDFLTSNRNFNQGQQGPSGSNSNYNSYQHNKRNGSKGSAGSGQLSVSLFDLVEPCSRPGSTSFSPSCNGTYHQNPTTSVSMYGLCSPDGVHCSNQDEKSPSRSLVVRTRPDHLAIPSKNPAIRLFYTIRSKFRKRRDRGSKSIESADFGPFISGSKVSYGYAGGVSESTHHHHIESARSDDQLQYLGTMTDDDTFSNPLGSRDKNYGQEGAAQRITSARSCFVISQGNSSSHRPSSSPATNSVNATNQSYSLAPPLNDHPIPNPSTLPTPTMDSLGVNVQPSTSTPSPVTPSSRSPSEPNRLKGLAKELFDLIHYGWYWGGLSKEEAEEKLRNEPDGAFIVRDSSSSVHILSLSFNSKGKTKHTRIDYVDGKFCFLTSETEAFASVAELIEHWIKNSEQGIYCYSKSSRANGPTSYPVRLTKPISRFTEVKSLQFLSSFVLYQYTRLDLIPKLPLPPQLIDFIGQQQYF